ncbi:MAG TPA: carboxypeptidase-like regulatory domain-containing protein, partial [Dysgonamonadaceae bacterium]|nr:carboxypeptidase-like regulatory domain-containing protein [Dysgonamonadaceae bacterium]
MNKLLIVKKIPIAMRITCLLLCLIVFQLQAEDVYSQKTKISLDMKNTTIEKVLQTIEEKSDYHFLYNNKLVNVDRKVSVRVKDAAISDVLDKLFKSGDVEYQVEGNQIILSPKEKITELVSGVESVQQQQKTITGKVTDTNGEPLIGANIMEKGTTNGTVTDIEGNFTLNVQDDAVLQISYIGYLTQEIAIGNKTNMNIQLEEDTQKLEEVVVLGYGLAAKKKDLSASVGIVADPESLVKRPVTST